MVFGNRADFLRERPCLTGFDRHLTRRIIFCNGDDGDAPPVFDGEKQPCSVLCRDFAALDLNAGGASTGRMRKLHDMDRRRVSRAGAGTGREQDNKEDKQ